MTTSAKIRDMIAAANALRAPLFSLATLLRGAEAIETKIATAQAAAATNPDAGLFEFAVVPSDLASDLETIEHAAEAAFAFVCCKHLPAELGEYREREDANNLIIAGIDVAHRH